MEEGVVLGRLPDRDIEVCPLVIGDNARIRSGSVLYACSTIGSGLETGHNAVVREECRIGDDFRLWSSSVVDYGCRIGDGVKIHCSCYIAQFTDIEDGVFFGPGVTVTNDLHPGCPASMRCMRGPTVKRAAVIGGGAILLPGVVIGERAFVGAGSVVTRDVAPGVVVAGNPARKLRSIGELDCPQGLVDGPYGG